MTDDYPLWLGFFHPLNRIHSPSKHECITVDIVVGTLTYRTREYGIYYMYV